MNEFTVILQVGSEVEIVHAHGRVQPDAEFMAMDVAAERQEANLNDVLILATFAGKQENIL